MILLDMGGLLPQEEWVLQKAVIAQARRFTCYTHFACKPHKSLRFDAG